MNATLPQPGIELDVCRFPNPFRGVAEDTFIDSSQTVLSMVDGGEDGEVIPMQPLLVKARDLDVIFAIDAVRCEYDIDFETCSDNISPRRREIRRHGLMVAQ
jgi:hypothetical protein